MIEYMSNPSRFIGFAYIPKPVWAQKSGYNMKPFIQLSLYFLKLNIDMPFTHNAKLQFGSRSERYCLVFNFRGFINFEWGRF